ncbi:MAG TPA: hypothetical protein VNH40_14550 [Gaiellaceae bacterium]|nr:hypothetical protein [Gaiellaceae bacterium]
MGIRWLRSRSRRRFALALALVSSSGVLAACGSVSATIDPVASAATKSRHAGSADLTFSLMFSSPSLSGGKAFTLSGTGVVGPAQADLKLDMAQFLQQLGAPAGTDTTAEEIFLEEGGDYVFYMRMGMLDPLLGGKHWLKVDASKLGEKLGIDFSKLTGGPTTQDPAQMLALLQATSGKVDDLGAETIAGVATTHYRANVDLAKAAELEGVSSQTLQQLTQAGVPNTIPEDVWIDSDGLIRQFRMSFDMTSAGVPLHMSVTMGLSNYGTAAEVTAPPASDVYDASELLLRGLGQQSSLPSA